MLKMAGEFIEGQLADHMAECDAHLKGGIIDVVRTGEYSKFSPIWYHAANFVMVADKLYAHSFIVPRDITVDRIAIQVLAAAADKSVRLGIYRDGTNLYPGALVLDAGTVTAGTTGLKAITINQSLTKGLYWLALVSDGTPTLGSTITRMGVLGFSNTDLAKVNTGWSVAYSYEALPDPFTAGGGVETTSTKNVESIGLRIASLD